MLNIPENNILPLSISCQNNKRIPGFIPLCHSEIQSIKKPSQIKSIKSNSKMPQKKQNSIFTNQNYDNMIMKNNIKNNKKQIASKLKIDKSTNKQKIRTVRDSDRQSNNKKKFNVTKYDKSTQKQPKPVHQSSSLNLPLRPVVKTHNCCSSKTNVSNSKQIKLNNNKSTKNIQNIQQMVKTDKSEHDNYISCNLAQKQSSQWQKNTNSQKNDIYISRSRQKTNNHKNRDNSFKIQILQVYNSQTNNRNDHKNNNLSIINILDQQTQIDASPQKNVKSLTKYQNSSIQNKINQNTQGYNHSHSKPKRYHYVQPQLIHINNKFTETSFEKDKSPAILQPIIRIKQNYQSSSCLNIIKNNKYNCDNIIQKYKTHKIIDDSRWQQEKKNMQEIYENLSHQQQQYQQDINRLRYHYYDNPHVSHKPLVNKNKTRPYDLMRTKQKQSQQAGKHKLKDSSLTSLNRNQCSLSLKQILHYPTSKQRAIRFRQRSNQTVQRSKQKQYEANRYVSKLQQKCKNLLNQVQIQQSERAYKNRFNYLSQINRTLQAKNKNQLYYIKQKQNQVLQRQRRLIVRQKQLETQRERQKRRQSQKQFEIEQQKQILLKKQRQMQTKLQKQRDLDIQKQKQRKMVMQAQMKQRQLYLKSQWQEQRSRQKQKQRQAQLDRQKQMILLKERQRQRQYQRLINKQREMERLRWQSIQKQKRIQSVLETQKTKSQIMTANHHSTNTPQIKQFRKSKQQILKSKNCQCQNHLCNCEVNSSKINRINDKLEQYIKRNIKRQGAFNCYDLNKVSSHSRSVNNHY